MTIITKVCWNAKHPEFPFDFNWEFARHNFSMIGTIFQHHLGTIYSKIKLKLNRFMFISHLIYSWKLYKRAYLQVEHQKLNFKKNNFKFNCIISLYSFQSHIYCNYHVFPFQLVELVN